MKVRELIEHLQNSDPEADVWFFDGDWTEHPCNSVTPWTHETRYVSSAPLRTEQIPFEVPRVLLE